MRYVYAIKLERDEDGAFVATSRDIPEALAEGATEQEALHEMSDALGAALAGYSVEGRALPEPSAAEQNEQWLPVAPLVAAKLVLRNAMAQEGITNVALAHRLGVSETIVRRLVDPDHASRLDRVVAALEVLGHGLIIEDARHCAA
jgi:antitoxin HicB